MEILDTYHFIKLAKDDSLPCDFNVNTSDSEMLLVLRDEMMYSGLYIFYTAQLNRFSINSNRL